MYTVFPPNKHLYYFQPWLGVRGCRGPIVCLEHPGIVVSAGISGIKTPENTEDQFKFGVSQSYIWIVMQELAPQTLCCARVNTIYIGFTLK